MENFTKLPVMRCRGADSRARRNAADPNRLSPKRHRPPDLSLRGPKGAVAISGRHCRLVPAAVKTEPVPTGLVAALTAQPLAALPPYGCGVPFTGGERHVRGNSTAGGHWCTSRSPDVSLRGAKRRGNLAVPGWFTGKVPAKSQLPSRDCHVASLLAMTRQAGTVVHQRPPAV